LICADLSKKIVSR